MCVHSLTAAYDNIGRCRRQRLVLAYYSSYLKMTLTHIIISSLDNFSRVSKEQQTKSLTISRYQITSYLLTTLLTTYLLLY